jgi:hypothetical protein
VCFWKRTSLREHGRASNELPRQFSKLSDGPCRSGTTPSHLLGSTSTLSTRHVIVSTFQFLDIFSIVAIFIFHFSFLVNDGCARHCSLLTNFHIYYIVSTMAYRLARAGLGPAGAVSTVTAISWMGERASTQATSRMATRSFQNRLLLHNKQFYSMERHQQRFFSNSNSNTTKPNPPTATATATATTEKAALAPNVALQSKSFMKWYEGHLQASPVKTKMVTGSILWGIGDGVAQLVPHMAEGGSLTEYKYDYPRTGRAALFGFALHAPTSHVHFNFLEWMTHKVGVTGLGIPVFKTIMEQVCNVM